MKVEKGNWQEQIRVIWSSEQKRLAGRLWLLKCPGALRCGLHRHTLSGLMKQNKLGLHLVI